MASEVSDSPGEAVGNLGEFVSKHKDVAIIGGGVVIVVLFIILRGKSSSSTSASGTPTDPTSCANAGGVWDSVNNVCGSGSSSTGSSAGGTDYAISQLQGQISNLQNMIGQLPANGSQNGNNSGNTPTPYYGTGLPGSAPLIPFGYYNGPSYSNLKPNTYYTWNGVSYLLKTGGGGRLYGINPQGQQIELVAPQGSYNPALYQNNTQGGTGGGPTNSSLHSLNVGIGATGMIPAYLGR